MKRYTTVVMGLLLMFSSWGAIAANQGSGLTDVSKPITVAKNKRTFTVSLKSNPTTGYTWLIKHYDARLMTLVSHHFTPPAARALVGAGGVETWTFRLNSTAFLAPHLMSIQFVYTRPWDTTDKSEAYVTVVSQ